MSAIHPDTRREISLNLEFFVEDVATKYRYRSNPEYRESYLLDQSASFAISESGNLKPFQAHFIPDALRRLAAFVRELRRELLTTLVESAYEIAKQYHSEAKSNYQFAGQASRLAMDEIDRQVSLWEDAATNNQHQRSLRDVVKDVLRAQNQYEADNHYVVPIDLYYKTHDGEEYFFYIIDPKPSKEDCLELLKKLLQIHLIRRQRYGDLNLMIAIPYNPYGISHENYNWQIAMKYLPFTECVTTGVQFWETVGESGVYSELLEIYEEVGAREMKYSIDRVVWGGW